MKGLSWYTDTCHMIQAKKAEGLHAVQPKFDWYLAGQIRTDWSNWDWLVKLGVTGQIRGDRAASALAPADNMMGGATGRF
jgi:hypothetical protein